MSKLVLRNGKCSECVPKKSKPGTFPVYRISIPDFTYRSRSLQSDIFDFSASIQTSTQTFKLTVFGSLNRTVLMGNYGMFDYIKAINSLFRRRLYQSFRMKELQNALLMILRLFFEIFANFLPLTTTHAKPFSNLLNKTTGHPEMRLQDFLRSG